MLHYFSIYLSDHQINDPILIDLLRRAVDIPSSYDTPLTAEQQVALDAIWLVTDDCDPYDAISRAMYGGESIVNVDKFGELNHWTPEEYVKFKESVTEYVLRFKRLTTPDK